MTPNLASGIYELYNHNKNKRSGNLLGLDNLEKFVNWIVHYFIIISFSLILNNIGFATKIIPSPRRA